MSIKDWSLHMTLGKSHIIVPSAYLGMGVGKACRSLVADPALSRPTDGKRRWWRSLPRTESGTQEWGLGVQVLDGDLDTQDRRVMGWSCLCLGCKWGVCLRGTQLGALIRESSAFRYGLSAV